MNSINIHKYSINFVKTVAGKTLNYILKVYVIDINYCITKKLDCYRMYSTISYQTFKQFSSFILKDF